VISLFSAFDGLIIFEKLWKLRVALFKFSLKDLLDSYVEW
jgi:hypothetical protein